MSDCVLIVCSMDQLKAILYPVLLPLVASQLTPIEQRTHAEDPNRIDVGVDR